MVHVFAGTKAQLIKMAPVMVLLRDRGIAFRYVDSGQHAETSRSLRRVFGLREPDVRLGDRAGEIVSIPQAVAWAARNAWRGLAHPAWLREEVFPGGGICLIHGDTLSTLLGLQMARRAGLKVAHVEAGLRSFRTWDPFPEELIRIHCMRRADVLFAPSDEAADNLRRMNVPGRVVQVRGNTVADALRLVDGVPTGLDLPDEPFALATCHRLETITSKRRLRRVVDLLNRLTERLAVVFVTHRPTRRALRRFGLEEGLNRRITTLGMLDYGDFVALQKAARLVVTDGGSIQEECAYLNKPCLIIRGATERPDGLGSNAALWAHDDRVVEALLAKAASETPTGPAELPRPSAEIVDTLVHLGYAEAADPDGPAEKPA